MEYKNLHKNYFVKYEDIFKIVESDKKNLKISLNSEKYIIENIEIIELNNDYMDLIIYLKNKKHLKNYLKTLQKLNITENIKTKKVTFDAVTEHLNLNLKGIILKDNFDIDKNIKLSFAIKKI